MFKLGDKILYSQMGVCVVSDICEKTLIKNKTTKYYVLYPLLQPNNIIYTPVENNKVFMRKIINKEQADNIICKIPEICKNLVYETLTEADYKDKYNTHNIDDLIWLTAAIYKKKEFVKLQKKKLGFVDEKYMHKAEELLFGELACALEIEYSEVQKYIEEKLKKG